MRASWLFRFLPMILCFWASAVRLSAQDSTPAAGESQPEAPTLEHGRKLMEQAKFAKAQEEFARLVQIDEQKYGEQDVKTLNDRVALAVARGKSGDSIKAESEMRQLLAIFTRRQGADQDETLRCRTALAGLLDDVGRPHEAVTEFRAVLEIRLRISGPDDLEVARVEHMLGDALTASNNFSEAIQQYTQAKAGLEKGLGPENAETLLNRSNLAMAKNSRWDFDAAEKDLKDVLAIRERLLGENDPSVLATCYYLAEVLQNAKKYPEALNYATRSMEGWRKTLGDSSVPFQKAARLCTEIQQNQTATTPSKSAP